VSGLGEDRRKALTAEASRRGASAPAGLCSVARTEPSPDGRRHAAGQTGGTMQSSELGTIQLGDVSDVTLCKLRTVFQQLAKDAREAGDEQAERVLLEIAGIMNSAHERIVDAM